MNRGWIAVGFAALVGSAQAQSASEKYDLAERCGRRAAEVFAERWGPVRNQWEKPSNSISVTTPGGGRISVSCENHYNSRLNKCFYLEINRTVLEDGRGPYTTMALYDINEMDKWIATFTMSEEPSFAGCWVEGMHAICRTEQEWLELIRPFMED